MENVTYLGIFQLSLLLTSSLIPFWSQKKNHIISTILNLLICFVVCLGECFMCAWGECIFCCEIAYRSPYWFSASWISPFWYRGIETSNSVVETSVSLFFPHVFWCSLVRNIYIKDYYVLKNWSFIIMWCSCLSTINFFAFKSAL